jgi:precorrin-3B C17-methyltransferase
MLYIVGIGPGDKTGRTFKSEEAILKSEIVVGYDLYIKKISDLTEGKECFSSGMKHEVERCRYAIKKVLEGNTVSLISSGDAGIYGMAGLVFEIMKCEELSLKIEIVSGVTASLAAASRMGAPLMLDYATISLSNLLVPLDDILEKLKCILKADMVVALYNPKSKKRIKPFEKAVDIIEEFLSPDVPVGIATDVGGGTERIEIITVDSLRVAEVNMKSVIIIGNSTSCVYDGWFFTPRGYNL